MSFVIVPLLGSAILALASGTAILIWKPNRAVTLLAGAALLLLGIQQLGWARAISAIPLGDRNYWLDLSLICWLPVSLAWLLLSITLGRGTNPEQTHGWRVFVWIEAFLSIGMLAMLHRYSPLGRSVVAAGTGEAVPVTSFGVVVLALLLLNVSLMSANFESTYVALSARWRRAFSPAILGIIFLFAWCLVFISSSILLGRLSLWDVSKSSIAFAFLALMMPLSLVKRRGVEAAVTAQRRPFYETLSFALGFGALLLSVGILQLSRLTGWNVTRSSWVVTICVTLLGLAGLAISGKFQLTLKRLLEPYLYTSRFDPEVVWGRLSHELDMTATRQDLCRLIPGRAAAITGVAPVTIFLTENGASEFTIAGSTLHPPPVERVGMDEPLACELRGSRHAIHLRGRPDDLGLIPIYVENAKQIAACDAACAVPLSHRGELMGFMLCGDPEYGREKLAGTLLLLEVVAQMVTTRLTSIERGE